LESAANHAPCPFVERIASLTRIGKSVLDFKPAQIPNPERSDLAIVFDSPSLCWPEELRPVRVAKIRFGLATKKNQVHIRKIRGLVSGVRANKNGSNDAGLAEPPRVNSLRNCVVWMRGMDVRGEQVYSLSGWILLWRKRDHTDRL
jgi:hypothetical protein